MGLNNRQIALREIPFLGWESPERMDRLLAADVMNCENLCYVYPITRVQSVEKLLRTTAYSAFLVVTPVEPEHVPERPKNVQDTHTPQLYRRPSIRGEWRVTERSGLLLFQFMFNLLCLNDRMVQNVIEFSLQKNIFPLYRC